MASESLLRLTYLGGPTAVLELGGIRLLTDPTFDPAGSTYTTPVYTLRKTEGPALGPDEIGPIDAVILSHDHHFDNLDRAGREFLGRAGRVLTTGAGAERLGGRAIGLEPWGAHTLTTPGGRTLRVTATPARHGPAGSDRGPVIGFMLEPEGGSGSGVYVSGDTVWYEGVAEVAQRFSPAVVVLFAGAARVREVGPANLTFTAAEAVTAARAFTRAAVVPLHFEGWEHFSESGDDLVRAFTEAGLRDRLTVPVRGRPLPLNLL